MDVDKYKLVSDQFVAVVRSCWTLLGDLQRDLEALNNFELSLDDCLSSEESIISCCDVMLVFVQELVALRKWMLALKIDEV